MWKEFLSKNGLTFWYLKRLSFNLMRKLLCFSGILVASCSLEIKPKTPGVARKASFIGHLSVPKFTNLFPSSQPLHKTFCLSAFHVLLFIYLFYIAHSFIISQPKLYILNFLIVLFIALPSCLFLTSGTFCLITLSSVQSTPFACLWFVCHL